MKRIIANIILWAARIFMTGFALVLFIGVVIATVSNCRTLTMAEVALGGGFMLAIAAALCGIAWLIVWAEDNA